MKLILRCAAPVILSLLCNAAALAHPGGVDAQGCHQDNKNHGQHCHPERVAGRSKAVYDDARPPRADDEGVFFGPFVSVTDGDTLHAKIQGVVMEFRLSDIDAPESDQPYGKRAAQELLDLLKGKQLIIVFVDVDRYGRIIGDIWADGVHVNREMVARGAAWFYAEYARNDALYQVEATARDARLGIWALPLQDRIEPHVWREQKRAAVAAEKASR